MLHKLVYLSGSMELNPDMGASWRKEVIPQFKMAGWDYFCPLENDDLYPFPTSKEFFESKVITVGDHEEINPKFRTVAKKFVDRDLRIIRSCQLLFYYFDGISSPGSSSEVTVAYEHGIPILLCLAPGVGLQRISSWILGCVTHVVTYDKFLKDTGAMLTALGV